MLLVYIVVPGMVSILASIAALVLGASWLAALAIYVAAGLATSVICIVSAALGARKDRAEAAAQQQIELELLALRESIDADTRMGAGSPDCLAPVLYRDLAARENWLLRQKRVQAIGPRDYVIRVPGPATPMARFWRVFFR